MKFLELSRRHLVNQQINKANPCSTSSSTTTSTPVSTVNKNITSELEQESEPEHKHDVEQDEGEYDDECPLSNPYYSRLLDSKLDSCPQQPFNETTNILWGAVCDTMHRNSRVETMSRWEQIQRGYVKQDNITTTIHRQESYYHTSSTSSTLSSTFSSTTRSQWVDTIIDVNDILQPHYSLDDCVRNNKENTTSMTLAKATGSIQFNELLDKNKNINKIQTKMENDDSECSEIIEMRNDLKWKRRKMKLHIKKKRRENLRMKKRTMRERNQQ